MLGQTLRFAFEGQYEVVVLNSGHDALDHLEHDASFDLVLCDLMMPVFSGIKVYEAIALRHPELIERFVFITGGAFTDSARDFLDSYPGLRLEKPFHVRDVETLLELSLERSARA
jgi:CheY-like chemotaxis protein